MLISPAVFSVWCWDERLEAVLVYAVAVHFPLRREDEALPILDFGWRSHLRKPQLVEMYMLK